MDAGAAKGASLTALDDVSLDATSADTSLAQAIGAGLGVAGVGISVATATDGGSTDAHSDANVNLTVGNDVSIAAVGTDDATADSTAGSGGIIAGDGADGTATIDPTITATTGSGSQINAVNEVSVVADLTPLATAQVTGVVGGRACCRRIGRNGDRCADRDRDRRRSRHHDHRRHPRRRRGNLPPGPQNRRGLSRRFLDPEHLVIPDQQHRYGQRQRQRVGRRLYGAEATSSTANDSGTVTSSIANQTTLYIGSTVDIAADGFTDQTAVGTSDFGGIIAAGANTATALSSAETTATVGSDVSLSAGDPIGGLQPGTIYYVVPDPSDPSLVSLASSSQNALMTSGGTFPQPGSAASRSRFLSRSSRPATTA